YWKQVLQYCIEGNLQAVLDEYVHMLVESEGLAAAGRRERSWALAERIESTASVRAVRNVVQDVHTRGRRIGVTEKHVNSHLAARFGRNLASESAEAREVSVHDGYTS